MDNYLRWEDVLERDDLVGGGLETQEDGSVYRGPITGIEIRDGYVHISTEWTAVLPGGQPPWRKLDNPSECFVDAELSAPRDIGEGRVHFVLPFLGHGTIFPKGGSQLDPNRVQGLLRVT